MTSFEELKDRFEWKPIRNCPGRFLLPTRAGHFTPEDLLGKGSLVMEFRVENAKDGVVVARIENGGIISYKKDDGAYLHTLNTPEALERKLMQLGIGTTNRED